MPNSANLLSGEKWIGGPRQQWRHYTHQLGKLEWRTDTLWIQRENTKNFQISLVWNFWSCRFAAPRPPLETLAAKKGCDVGTVLTNEAVQKHKDHTLHTLVWSSASLQACGWFFKNASMQTTQHPRERKNLQQKLDEALLYRSILAGESN